MLFIIDLMIPHNGMNSINSINSQDPEMCFMFFNTARKMFRYLCTVKNLRMLFYYAHSTYILQAVRFLRQSR